MNAGPRNVTIAGVPVSPGLAQGTAFVFQDIVERDLEAYSIQAHDVEKECARIERAIRDVLRDLSVAAERIEQEFDSAMANIFRAHGEMLRDATFTNEIRTEVARDLVNVEHALRSVFGRWEERFRTMENETLRRRSDDIVDIGRRLLRSLAGVHANSLERMPRGSILVARRLLPSDTTFFSVRSVAGIVVEKGGPGSHCALLTRQMGIPGIAQVPRLLERVMEGDRLLLDGLQGTVTIAPDEDTRAHFNIRMRQYRATDTRAGVRAHEPAITRDGVTIPVMANIGNRHDADTAIQNGADGVGLFRIEVFFLSSTMLPTEEEMVAGIAHAIEPFKGRPVAIRLLDIGGDKTLPYLPLPAEPNPFLGRRGVRLLLEYPELLALQLRALLRISRDHDLQIIVPMITVADDMRQVRTAMKSVASKLGLGSLPQLGAMIETPAAALCADEIAEVSDFFNIGTNDLTQYTMAAGRENAFVGHYFKDDHPAIMMLLRHVGDRGDSTAVPGMRRGLDSGRLLRTIVRRARAAGFEVQPYGHQGPHPLYGLTRPAMIHAAARVYLSSGMHGDEPAGPLTIAGCFLRGDLSKDVHWFICPLLNPVGLTRGSRENGDGIDMNRDYRDRRCAEVRAHIGWLEQQPRFDLALLMHEDWEAKGFYLNEFKTGPFAGPDEQVIRAVRRVCPIDQHKLIDGMRADHGIVHPFRCGQFGQHWPESFFLRHLGASTGFNFETPSSLPLAVRVAALRSALCEATQPFLGHGLASPGQSPMVS